MSKLLEVMPEGIGDLTFATPDWVDVTREVLTGLVSKHAKGLSDLGTVSLCEVAHNPPAYLHAGTTLAWYAQFDGASVKVGGRELPDKECDFKVHGDHSILSNLARIRYHDNDPKIVARAQERLGKLSRWELVGSAPKHKVLGAVLRQLHDAMAPRTMPRFVFMTPEWVSTARHIVSTRATSEEYSHGIRDVDFTFSEEFTDTPTYAFPDGSHGGFWIRCVQGQVTVGAGPLPEEFEPADALTKGVYTPVVPVGRTVNAAMTEEEKAEAADYSKSAFRFDKQAGRRPVDQSSPSGKGPMPPALGRVLAVLHDELSKRTSGELPLDFDSSIKAEWAIAQTFDRVPGYESWVTYDEFDIYGNARR